MRRLLLLRHSKTERPEPGRSDEARILTERGRVDAAIMGTYLVRHDLVSDRVTVSPAARTRETWGIASAAMQPAPVPHFEPRIYDAETQTLFNLVASTPNDAKTLLMVGHNPGFHELAVLLVATGDIETRERMQEDMPTSALAVIDFAFDEWSQLHPRCGRLERFVSPKALEFSPR